jgi:hypothetical protein
MELEANRTDTNMGFLVHLDRRVELTGTYDAVERLDDVDASVRRRRELHSCARHRVRR